MIMRWGKFANKSYLVLYFFFTVIFHQISSDRERIQHQESRIQELESDLTKLEAELRAQAAAHEMASHRVREGDAQLHASYTSVLNKLVSICGDWVHLCMCGS